MKGASDRSLYTPLVDEEVSFSKTDPRGFPQSEIFSSLPLQLTLFYNVLFSLGFALIEGYTIQVKLQMYEIDTFRVVLMPLVFFVWCSAEVFRLWFGYTGNINEKVPQLSAFFLVTLFPQLPCLLYMIFSQGVPLPLDRICAVILTIFSVVETYLSYTAIKVFVMRQSANFFRLMQDDEDESDDEDMLASDNKLRSRSQKQLRVGPEN